MNTVNSIIHETLSNYINCTIWKKGTKKRLYIKAGYNTKKCKQNIYIDLVDFQVVCYTNCPSQTAQWCRNENEKVVERYASHARLAKFVAYKNGGNVTLEDQITSIEIEAANDELANEIVYGYVNHWRRTRVKINQYGKLAERNRQFSQPWSGSKKDASLNFVETGQELYDVFVRYLGDKSEVMLQPYCDAPNWDQILRIVNT